MTLSEKSVEYGPPEGGLDEATIQRRIQIQKCSVCGEPTFRTYRWIEPFSDPLMIWIGRRSIHASTSSRTFRLA